MPKMAVTKDRFKHFNIGDFLSAKIYSDIKGNACSCGGQYLDKKIVYEDEHDEKSDMFEIPICNSCKKTPRKFRINARVENENGAKKTITIRNSQDGLRLTKVYQVITCLCIIKQEIREGRFDVRKYSSSLSKESFLFENFIQTYIKYYEKKASIKGKEGISPATLRKKKTLISLHLLPYFKGIEIGYVDRVKIKKFKDSWADQFSTRNQCLGELKRILNYAFEYEYIKSVPKFDKIPKSRSREKIAHISTIREVLPFVDDVYYYRIFRLLDIYPIRPCEVRCLRWKDIDFRKKTITIQRHLSDGVELDGRKSIDIDSESGKGKITYPLTSDARTILKEVRSSINIDDLIFESKRKKGAFISHTVLPDHWRKACKLAGVEYFEPYEIKHARATEITEQNNGNLKLTMDVLGQTNVNTTLRYIQKGSNLKEVFH